jgi:hypothetical protein
VFKVEGATEYKSWHGLHAELSRMSADNSFRNLQLMTPNLQKTLQNLLDTTSVDLSGLRSVVRDDDFNCICTLLDFEIKNVWSRQLSGSVTSKDLTSFAKQMENVANQIKDGATAGRLTSLVAKIRRLVSSNILPLETRRVCIQYRSISLSAAS